MQPTHKQLAELVVIAAQKNWCLYGRGNTHPHMIEAIVKIIGEIESRVAGECLDSLPEKECVLEKDVGYHSKDCCEESWRWNEARATLKAVTKKYLKTDNEVKEPDKPIRSNPPTPPERERDCPFCLMVNKFTTGRVFDIEPLNPVTPGHRLIIPAEHVSNFSDDPDLTAEVMRYAAEYAKRHGIDCNLIASKGSPATQTVFHLHVHIIPRNYNDGLALPWDTTLTKRTVWLAALGAVREKKEPKNDEAQMIYAQGWNAARKTLIELRDTYAV